MSNNNADEKTASGREETSDEADDESQGERETSGAEKAVMVISVSFTVLLFAYAGWQMAAAPDAESPEVTVVETAVLENDSVAVTVRVRNPTDAGLISATVESDCSFPPASVSFSYVPALSTRTGTLVCSPRTTNPSVSFENWVRP